MPSSRGPRRSKGKIHVFPYAAVKPIIGVDSSGNVTVTPLEAKGEIAPIPVQTDELNNLIQEIRNFPIRRFEKQIGDVQDVIRSQTKNVIDAIGELRLDANYEPVIAQHRQLMEDNQRILERLNGLAEKNSGNAQVEQGFQVLVEEVRESIRQIQRLNELGETVSRLQTVTWDLSTSVSDFLSGERNWEKMDVVLDAQGKMMEEIAILRREGMIQIEPLIENMNQAIQSLKDSVLVRLDKMEDLQKEIQKEIHQYSESQKTLEEIRAMVSIVPVDRQAKILEKVESLSTEIASIPRIHQGEMLETMKGMIRGLGILSETRMNELPTRLEGLRLAIETQRIDLEELDRYIRSRPQSSDEYREILEKLEVLNVSSRLTVIEEGLRILSEKPEFNETRILENIAEMIRETRPQISFQPLLDRMDTLERSLNFREEFQRGFEDLRQSIGKDGEGVRKIQSGVEGMQREMETAFRNQLELLSRIEMKIGGEDQSSKILEYQTKLARCMEEKSGFERKIGSLTMEIENLRSRLEGTSEQSLMEESVETQFKIRELTTQIDDLQSKLSLAEKDLEAARRDKTLIDPRINQLERQLSERSGRVADLEEELRSLRARVENLSVLEAEKRKLETEMNKLKTQLRELETTLAEKTRELERVTLEKEEFRRRVGELTEQLENLQTKTFDYMKEHETLMGLIGKIDREIITHKVLIEGQEPVERLSDLIDHLVKLGQETPKETTVLITDVPRYSVYPDLDEIMKRLLNKDQTDDQAEKMFAESKKVANQKLFNYYQQIQRTKADTQTILRTSNFLHKIRGLIFAEPGFLDQVSEFVPDSKPLVAQEVEDLQLRPLEPSVTNIGRFVLTNAFSPILPVSVSAERVNEIAPKVASTIYRVFYIQDVMKVVTTLDNLPKNISFENELKEELSGIGKWNPTRTQILLEVEDLYRVSLKILANIRGFLSRIKTINSSLAYGLEMRYILLDAFMKALEECRLNIERISQKYEARDSLPDPQIRNLLSYVKIRGDEEDVDPRFVFKVDDSRRKILLGHQPFVFSSGFVSDFGNFGSYQHDLYGPMTRVFTPRDTNADIGNNLGEMVEELNKGRDVCALALGPSGAGKTSTLLYFRGNPEMNISPENGALPQMLSRVSPEYVEAEVKAVEMTSSYIPGSGVGNYWRDYPVFEGGVTFSREGSEWMSQTDVSLETMDYESLRGTRGVCEISKPFEEIQRVRREFGKISIANFLSKLIDIRLNCGTINNPDSSRTHLFVFIQLKNTSGSQNPYLIISDLAGREKAFDCGSETVLEILSMNRWYPELNSLVQNPLEGGLRTSSKKDIPDREQLKDKKTETSFKTVINALAEVNASNINEAINDGYVKVFFFKPIVWYMASTDKTLNRELYQHVQTVSSFIVRENFFKKIEQRFENLDRQPEILKKILTELRSKDNLIIIDGILRYYASDKAPHRVENPTTLAPDVRLRFQLKTLTGIDLEPETIAEKHKLVIKYLNAVIVVNALEQVINGRPKEVCEVRNTEGVFINRSLDEYSQLVMTAASIDTNYGPLMHPECMPVVCEFAGMDCLLPKNVPRDIPQSAISRVLSRGMGTPAFRPETLFSIFLVVNASRTQPEKRVRPIYDPLEVFMKQIYELCRGIEEKSFYAYRQDQNLLTPLSDALNILSSGPEGILGRYKDERSVLEEYIARVDYRGTDESRMLRDQDIQDLYRRSKKNWEEIRTMVRRILDILSDERFPSMNSQTRSRFTDLMNTVSVLRFEVNRKNQDTIPGALAFVDEVIKRGMQPKLCTTDEEETLIPPTQISSWRNALYDM